MLAGSKRTVEEAGATDIPSHTRVFPDESTKSTTTNPVERPYPQNSDMESTDRTWEVAESKNTRRKRRKLEREEVDGPSIFLKTRPDRVDLKALQDLTLYVLADGIAPNWLAVKNAKLMKKVVVLMVPGLDERMLTDDSLWPEASLKDVSGPDENGEQLSSGDEDGKARRKEASHTTMISVSASDLEVKPTAKTPRERLLRCILEVKAPGDGRVSRVFSPLQTMLIAPFTSSAKKSNKSARDDTVRTSIAHFVHSAEELQDAEYPIHPALFSNKVDAALEQERREATGQSVSSGWVDTKGTCAWPSLSPATTPSKSRDPITKGLKPHALDCEMVLTDDDKYSLARVSLIDWSGKVVLDKYVKPSLPIKNYFTEFSGITESILKDVTTSLQDIQKELLDILGQDTILLGHSLESDLCALHLTHPFVVDTSIVFPHPRGLPLRSSLKYLANKYLKREIQKGGANGHDSVEDARAVLDLIKLKCERGPAFGTLEANGESIFRRIGGTFKKDDVTGDTLLKTSAIVEYGTPERGLGKEATYHIACEDDDDIMRGLLRAATGDIAQEEDINPSDHKNVEELASDENGETQQPPTTTTTPQSTPRIPPGGVDFIWSRLRDLEVARDWNNPRSPTSHAASSPTTTSTLLTAQRATLSRILQIYTSLPPDSLFILCSGTNDMRPLLRLQAMHNQYKKEFKVKKWDELSIKWTDREEQDMKRACEAARRGLGVVAVT